MSFVGSALLSTLIFTKVASDGGSESATPKQVCPKAPLAAGAQKRGHALLQLAKGNNYIADVPTDRSLGFGPEGQTERRLGFGPDGNVADLDNATNLLGPSPGARVSISEKGFEEIKKLNCRKEMAEFTRRVVADMGYDICQEGGLQGTVGYYFQVSSKKTFKDLKADVLMGFDGKCPWLGRDGICLPLSPDCPHVQDKGASHRRRSCAGPPSSDSLGSTLALDNTGFNEVKNLHCRLDMDAFMRRTIDLMGFEVCHEGGLQGLVSFYIENDVSDKTFEDLKKDIEIGTGGECPWLGKDGNCPPMPPSCDEKAEKSAAQVQIRKLSPESLQVEFASANKSSVDRLQERTHDPDLFVLSLLSRQGSQGRPGSRVGLNEKGFEKIKNLSSREDMEEFARRAVIDLGYEVCHEGGLLGMIDSYFQPYSEKSFQDLKQDIRLGWKGDCPWVAQDGKCPSPSEGCHNVPEYDPSTHRRRTCIEPPSWNNLAAHTKLNQSAFEEIKEMHCRVEMNLFLRRVINFMAYNICHEGGFHHLVSVYVNTNVSNHTLEDLKEDINDGIHGECNWLSTSDCQPLPESCQFSESHRRRSCKSRTD